MELYDKFVVRSLLEINAGLKMDNCGNSSLQKRVSDALERRFDDKVHRCPAEKVIDGRFILGGNDASYLASGLAVLWSTVGVAMKNDKSEELSLAPAALYSPQAVNGIRRGLIAAMVKRNNEMRDEAPNVISLLMRALVPLLPFIVEEGETADETNRMSELLINGELKNEDHRKKLLKFLMKAKSAICCTTEGDFTSSHLSEQIITASITRHHAVLEAQKEKRLELVRNNEDLKRDVNELKEDTTRGQEENTRLTSRNALLQSQLCNSILKAETLEQRERALKEQLESCVTDSIDVIKLLREQSALKETELRNLILKIEAVELRERTYKQTADSSFADAEETIITLREQLVLNDTQIDALIKKSTGYDDLVTDLKATKRLLLWESNQNSSYRAELQRKYEEVSTVRANMAFYAAEHAAQVEDLERKLRENADELATMETSKNDLQKDLTSNESSISGLKQSIDMKIDQVNTCIVMLQSSLLSFDGPSSFVRRRTFEWDEAVRLELISENKERAKLLKVLLSKAREDVARSEQAQPALAEFGQKIQEAMKLTEELDVVHASLMPKTMNPNNTAQLSSHISVDNRENTDRAWIETAVLRGLVGQRGPTELAAVDCCPTDALLPYTLPDIKDVVKHMLPAHLLLMSTPDPTTEEVCAATAVCADFEHVATGECVKRQRMSQYTANIASPAVTSEAMALFQDNFAIIGETPADSLSAERCGVELPHEVRWMPHGPRGGTMARVAVLEHAVARCVQIASQDGVRTTVAKALHHAAKALKLQQLAPLYELHQAAEYDDEPHPLGTGVVRLVTRPCAVVRDTLSFPTDAGVTLLEEGSNNAHFTHDASLAQAIGTTAVATATLRNRLRRQGLPSNVYVAPQNSEMAFHSAPTGATTSVDNSSDASTKAGSTTSERVSRDIYSNDTFQRIINRLIVATAACHESEGTPDPVAAFLDANVSNTDGAGAVNAQTRREGLWTEMHRHVAISQDRLWIFIRLMSGKIGGSVSEVITLADEATLKAAKDIQQQRLEISKRVSDMQAKIVETVVSSMLKNSNMTMDYTGSNLAVIDAGARKDLKDLRDGASGRPFFEANVALKNLTEKSEDAPQLQKVLAGLANVGTEMQTTLERTLADPSSASASLIEMSHPSNSYFVSLRADAVAAIREAQEKLNCEIGALGGSRRLMLWELVEGGCSVLVQRFADLCGFLLVQTRTSMGVSAMYVSQNYVATNAMQARVALSKLLSAAMLYVARVTPPVFDSDDPVKARFEALTMGEKVRDIDITAQCTVQPRRVLHAPISGSRFYVEGGRR